MCVCIFYNPDMHKHRWRFSKDKETHTPSKGIALVMWQMWYSNNKQHQHIMFPLWNEKLCTACVPASHAGGRQPSFPNGHLSMRVLTPLTFYTQMNLFQLQCKRMEIQRDGFGHDTRCLFSQQAASTHLVPFKSRRVGTASPLSPM